MENNENKTPVTEEKKVESTNPVVEEKKEGTPAAKPEEVKTEENKEDKPAEKKAKKSLFAKEKKPWEEDKPKEPLDSKDLMCIGGFVLLVLVAFIPYLIRILDASYDDTRKFSLKGDDGSSNVATGPKSKKKLTCSKEGTAEGYNYTIDVVSLYADGNPESNDITYKITEITDTTLTYDTVELEEYKTISELPSEGIKASHETGSAEYKIFVNYVTDSTLIKNSALSEHFKNFSLQLSDYQNKGYTCTQEKLEG